jgi:hypothetical protein
MCCQTEILIDIILRRSRCRCREQSIQTSTFARQRYGTQITGLMRFRVFKRVLEQRYGAALPGETRPPFPRLAPVQREHMHSRE